MLYLVILLGFLVGRLGNGVVFFFILIVIIFLIISRFDEVIVVDVYSVSLMMNDR